MEILYSIITLANILAFIFLAAIIFSRNRSNILNQALSACAFFSTIWIFSHFARYAVFPVTLAVTKAQTFYWGKVSHIGASFCLSYMAYFFIIFPDRRFKLPRFSINFLLLCVLPIFFSVLTLQDLVVSDMNFSEGRYYIVAGPAFPLFTIFALSMLIISIVSAVIKMRTLTGVQRLQTKYVATGMMFMATFGVLINAVLPTVIRIWPQLSHWQFLYRFAPFYMMFFIYFTSYAILKHRLLDIEIVISRSAGYAVAVAVVIGLYVLIVTVVERFVRNFVGYDTTLVASSSALVIAFLFHPLQLSVQNGIYNKFFAKRFAYQAFLLEASRSIVTILNLEELVSYFIETVQKYVGMDRVAFLMRSDDEEPGGGHVYYIHSYRGVAEDVANKFAVRNGLISWFKEKRQVFVKDEVEFEMEEKGFSKLYGQLHLIGADLMVPVFTKDKLAGILALDRKTNGRTYSQQDIDIFNILAAEVGVAIDNARLYGEAITDSLTGMFNRRYFDYRLNEEILRAQRYHRSLSLLMIDLDHFKQVNDKFGHPAGDYVLKQIARVIRSSLRQIDIVCRYGGEEIAIILPETGEKVIVNTDGQMRTIDACRTVAERIRRHTEQHEFWFGQQKIPVNVSIGMAYYADVASQMVTMAEIVGTADRALYQAKQSGRNCVKGFI